MLNAEEAKKVAENTRKKANWSIVDVSEYMKEIETHIESAAHSGFQTVCVTLALDFTLGDLQAKTIVAKLNDLGYRVHCSHPNSMSLGRFNHAFMIDF